MQSQHGRSSARSGGPVVNPFGLSGVLTQSFRSMPAAADLDGDGDVDLLVGESDGSFAYFENIASAGAAPEFAEQIQNPFGLEAIPQRNGAAPSVADLDGDGDLDVLAGSRFQGAFMYFENVAGPGGMPSFASAVSNPFGLTGLSGGPVPVVVDLDGDSDPDILSGERLNDGRFFYYENTAGPNTTPAFAPRVTNPFGLGDIGFDSTPNVGDLDGDGDLDILAGEREGELFFFENVAGPGAQVTFAAAVQNPFGLGDVGLYSAPVIVDLDGDDRLDVIVGEYEGNLFYFENATSAVPNFEPAVQDPFELARIRGIPRNSTPSVADLDSDGDLDVLSGELRGDFSFFENLAGPDADPAFADAVLNPFGESVWTCRFRRPKLGTRAKRDGPRWRRRSGRTCR